MNTPFDHILTSYKLIKSKSTRRYPYYGKDPYRKPNGEVGYKEKFVIFYHERKQKYCLLDPPTGRVIDYKQYAKQEGIMEERTEETYAPPSNLKEDLGLKSIKAIEDYIKWQDNSMHNYLVDARGIDTNSYIEFKTHYGEIFKTTRYGAIFTLKDATGTIIGTSRRTSALHRMPNKKLTKGIRGLFYALGKRTQETFITESPIDALSIYCLMRQSNKQADTGYIATCGPLSYTQKEILKELKLQGKVYICGDNDEAGRAFEKKIYQTIKGDNVYAKRPKEGFKDFNEYLMYTNKKA